ncbi:MAG: phosphoadenylyl-sulfate reductase [Bacteroidota bacterium]
MKTIAEIREKYASLAIADLLIALTKDYAGRIAFSSSMGAEDQVITHIIAENAIPIRIFTIDTGRMFPETYEVIDKTCARYKIPIEVYFPDYQKMEPILKEKGINLFYESVENRKLCCFNRKIEPLQRALQRASIWITGLRAEQSASRSQIEIIEWDETHRLIKVNPLMNWTLDQMWNFIKLHHIPYNSLHDQSFPSIGCQPCTIEVKEGDDIRSGRWWWEQGKKECGLHGS